MGNSWFKFKQFTIEQQGAAMKVGTDGVLVGAWSFIPASGSVLDIGSGTGIIALMAAQRSVNAEIDAIEIEESAYYQCKDNFANSPWSNRCNAIHCSVFEYSPQKLYNAIICNPPFFVKSLKNPNKQRETARHCNKDFNHKHLLDYVIKHLLAPDGLFSLILPVEEAKDLIAYAQSKNIGINRIAYIHSFPDKPAIRYLIEFSNDNKTEISESTITLYQNINVRSAEYSELMKDFYL